MSCSIAASSLSVRRTVTPLLRQLRCRTQRSQHAKLPSVAKVKDKWISSKTFSKAETVEQAAPTVPQKVHVDNVWLMSDFAADPLSLPDAICRLRSSVRFYGLTNSMLSARLQLNMCTERKTKFFANIRGLIDFPNAFEDGPSNNVILFCKRENHIELARKYGCYLYGNEDLLKMFVAGEIMDFSYDYLLCTPDVYGDISRLRKRVTVERFPTQANGQLVVDVEKALKKFRFGHFYESCKLSDSLAILRINMGKEMAMPDEELCENFSVMMAEIMSRHSPPSPKGLFVSSATIICAPCVDRYPINVDEYAVDDDDC